MSKEVLLNFGDVSIENGDAVLVEKSSKLEQDIGKIIITEKDGYFHPDYGSDLYDLIGRYETGEEETLMKKAIIDALNYYHLIQYRQNFAQDLDPEEIYLNVTSLNVEKKYVDGTPAYTIYVEIQNAEGNKVPILTRAS